MKPARKPGGEPIAIIGMSGRFPGAPDPAALWKLVADKRDGLAEYPGGRSQQLDAFYEQAGAANRPPTRRGGFLPDADKFDAAFFAITPREAEWTDPQQRLLLEIAFEAVEDAGQSLDALAGSRTGVFIGAWTNDYEVHANANSQAADFFNLTGGPIYGASSRIAYQFDLRGPEVSVNAASAASLAAVHLATRSLRAGECSLALSGGVNMIFRHEQTQAFSRANMLAGDGRCKFGDARADGIVRSEGMGLLVLRRLSDAAREGDRILGLILGTALTNGGRGGGSISTPSEAGQRQAMLDALDDAGAEPASIQYVEAHGTGSRAGDPVELAAIGSVYGGGRSSPCRTGSVKSNIGHAESAAGVAGIIKTLQAFQHRLFPPTLHVERPNPAIDWASSGIVLEQQGSFWETESHAPRRAAVNGLALTGMNAHVVLEEAPPMVAVDTPPRRAYILPISAASQNALRQRARDMAARLEDAGLGNLCYTAAVRRSHLKHRWAAVGTCGRELRERLEAYARGEETSFAVPAVEEPQTVTRLAALGQLYAQGQTVDWKAIYPCGNQVALPAYPWQRERFWIESSALPKSAGRTIEEKLTTPGLVSEAVAAPAAANFAGRLRLLPANHVRPALAEWLREQVAAVLDRPIDRVLPDKTLESLGLDSLTAMEFNDRVERGLGLEVSTSMVWNYATITALSGHLQALLAVQAPSGSESEREQGALQGFKQAARDSTHRSAAEMLEAELLGAETLLRN
jgi:acyl transferase domain-containing protein